MVGFPCPVCGMDREYFLTRYGGWGPTLHSDCKCKLSDEQERECQERATRDYLELCDDYFGDEGEDEDNAVVSK